MSTSTDSTLQLAQERADLLETLQAHRAFLRFTVQGVTDDQARQRTTASALTLGGLIKHVAATEASWAGFIVGGAAGMGADADQYGEDFTMTDGESLADLLAGYDAVARRTDELVRRLPDLDASNELPPAPWFPAGKRYSARRVLLHIVAETSQHAGHADIIRESLDGQKTMG
jgi:uncharacterized damage-inducible protein DinB